MFENTKSTSGLLAICSHSFSLLHLTPYTLRYQSLKPFNFENLRYFCSCGLKMTIINRVKFCFANINPYLLPMSIFFEILCPLLYTIGSNTGPLEPGGSRLIFPLIFSLITYLLCNQLPPQCDICLPSNASIWSRLDSHCV